VIGLNTPIQQGNLRLRRWLGTSVHPRQRAHRPPRRSRQRARRTTALLRLGWPTGPVRAPLGQRRRRVTRTEMAFSADRWPAADPAVVGPAPTRTVTTTGDKAYDTLCTSCRTYLCRSGRTPTPVATWCWRSRCRRRPHWPSPRPKRVETTDVSRPHLPRIEHDRLRWTV